MLAGVGLDLGSVDRHMTQLHQASFGTKQQSLREQTRERIQMTLAELRDGGVVRVLVAGKITEGYVLQGARLNLARTVDALRITVQEQTHHHLRRIGRLAATILVLIGPVDRAQIQRRNHVDQKTGKVAIGKPVVKRWWKQQRLVNRVSNEVLPHGSNLK